MEELMISRDQTLMEKIHDLGTNLLFNVSNWSLRQIPFSQEDDVVYQGQKMNEDKGQYEANLQATIEKFSNTIWITYRKNFPTLLANLSLEQQMMRQYISDTGWGCMVRVGQMTFAEALRRHLVSKKSLPEKPSRKDLIGVISAFLDEDACSEDVAPYSIQKIARVAYQEFNLCPGEWYTPSRICYILGLLHNEKKCMEGTKDLKIALFSSSQPIIYEDFLEAMCKVDPNNGKHNQLCRQECKHQTHLQKQDGKQQQEWKRTKLVCEEHNEDAFSLLAFIVCRIGVDSPDSEYLKVAMKMMDFKCSLGMIGGRPRKALYFLGRVGEDFIYLDPHYVQESSNKRNLLKPEQLESFFCSKFSLYPAKNIDSSFSFAFYFSNLQELDEFYAFMNALKKENPEYFFLMFKDENPKRYIKSTSSNILSAKNLQREAEEKIRRQAAAEAEKQKQMEGINYSNAEDLNAEDDLDDYEFI